jgi:hypothetical protein
MSMTASSFYVTGGTVPPGTPSYVERQADRELFEGLARGGASVQVKPRWAAIRNWM